MDTFILVVRTDVDHADGVQVCVGTFRDDTKGIESADDLIREVSQTRKGTYEKYRATKMDEV